MNPKLRNILGCLYYIDEFGVWHEINGIPTVEVVPSSPIIGSNPFDYNCELTVKPKSSKVVRKLAKEHIKWINCLNRHIRREKRIKEQERRSMLKWRALHHDGE